MCHIKINLDMAYIFQTFQEFRTICTEYAGTFLVNWIIKHLHCLIYDINVILLQVVLIIIFLFCLLQSDICEFMKNMISIGTWVAVGVRIKVWYLFYNNKDLSSRSYVSHCPHLRKMNSVYDILPLCSRTILILSSHLQVHLPSGSYHRTTPTHFSTNAFHSGCRVCTSISSTLHFKESCKCTASSFFQYRFMQVFNCTVISHNLADAGTKYEM